MNRILRLLLTVGVVSSLGTLNAAAQTTAQINGTVVDESGAALPGVAVAALHTGTGFRRDAVTDTSGSYTLTNLPIGPYRLEASLAGFRTYVQTGIVLQVNSNPVIPVKLLLGALEETVSVEAAAPLVETRNPAIGAVIDNEAVEALPLEGRNVASLVVLAGSAVDTGNPSSRSLTQSRGIAVAGGQQFGVQYFLDGAMHNNWYDGVNLPLPFPDAMQEIRVETSSQNAQNGVKAGGTVSVATKAGTNLYRGDVFEFARHHRFNAKAPFAAVNPTTGERASDGLVRNQFGGVLGGPIIPDKIFFFGAYQGTRTTQTPADIITFIPTAAMMSGDFTTVASAQCRAQGNLALPPTLGFTNNRINPALFSPAAVKIAGLLPTTADACGQIAYSRPTKPTEDMPIGRIDWQINPNHSLFARYMLSTTFWDPAFENADGNILAATLGGRDNTVHSFVIGDSMVLNNSMVNSIRYSVSRTSVVRTHSELFGPEDVGVNMFTYIPEYMNLTITGAFSINTGTETFSFYKPNTYSFSDDFTVVRGNHQFGIGGAVAMSDWQTESNVRSMGPMSFSGGATGLPLADFLLGRVFEFREATPFRQDIKQPYFALYAQDTWRMSPNVTVNYGLRWEPWFPQDSVDQAVYTFDVDRMWNNTRSTVYPQAPAGLYYPGDPGFPGNSGMNIVWSNLAPRVGVAWDPRGDGRTSLRAGYGLTGDFVTGQFFFDSRSAPPFGLEQRLTNTRLDDPWGAVGRSNPYPVPLGGDDYPYNAALYSLFISMPTDIKTTRNHAWNVAFQRQLGDNMALSATYMGNRMTNMWGVVDGNPGVIPAGATPTGPCTLRLPAGGTQTFANCSTAPLDLRRELSQVNPPVGQVLRLPRLDHRRGLAELSRTSAVGSASFRRRPHDQRELYDLHLRRADQPGPGAVERRHRIHEARLVDRSTVGCRTRRHLRRGQGAMRHLAQTHLQPERQHRDAAVQQCDRTGARVGVAPVRDLPCEFRRPADGLHRHRPGAFGNSGDDAAGGSGAGQSVRRQDDQQLAQPAGVFAARAGDVRKLDTQRLRRSGAAGRRSIARAGVQVWQQSSPRGARRSVQCVQLVPAGEPEHDVVGCDLRAHHSIR